MEKSFSFNIMGLVIALFTMSVCLTSCSDGFSDGVVNAPQRTDTTPTPQPDDSDNWNHYMKTWHKVFENSFVESHMIGQKGGKNVQEAKFDTLHIRYKYEYSLLADTTLYLDTAPAEKLGYTSASHGDYTYTDGGRNAQGDSILSVNFAKNYTLTNGIVLNLSTKRLHAWHEMDGILRPYSEPNETIGQIDFSPSTEEFERNDSIFGVRTNVVTVPLTLGDKKFYASCSIKEIWFVKLKDTPEPKFDVFVNEPVSHLASSMVQLVPSNNWKNVHLMVGASKVHPIVVTTDAHNAKVVSVEDKPVDRSRVIVSNQVSGSLYDPTTGLFITAILTPDNDGWEGDGVIDGRHVEYSRSYAQMIDEGVKNFQETDTSKPTLTFSGVSAKVTSTWKEYEYTTITWTKYSKEGKAYMNTIVVKSPKK
jgi:hypothetical protein